MVGYDSSGNTVFCENCLTVGLVYSHQMVVPSWKALCKLESDTSQVEKNGRFKSKYDPIKKLYYDKDLDNHIDPYLTLEIQRRLEQRTRREFHEEGG